MYNNIYTALERIGLTAQKRAIHLKFSNNHLNQQVFLQHIEGTHALNSGIKLQLICLSTNDKIPLKQFIASQVAIDIVTDRSELTRTSGIITQAEIGASDGALTIYRLTVEDPTALWKHRRNSRVFMNKTAIDVIQILFKEWQSKSPLFASSLSLDLSGLSKDYDVRPFIMQYNERDICFIQRLLAEEGVSTLIDEAQLSVPHSKHPIQAQKLRLIDNNSAYKSLERRTIRFHRSSAVEQTDSITHFIGQRSIQPTAVHLQRWQADILDIEEGIGSVLSKQQQSDNQDNSRLSLEQAWYYSPAWIPDLNGTDGVSPSGNRQIEKINDNLNNYHSLQAKQFTATSTVRDAQVGYWFEFTEHPEIQQHTDADNEFLITAKNFYNQSNLPKDLNDQINHLLKQSQWQSNNQNNTEQRQANTLTLQRRNIAIVPKYHPLKQRPIAHPQRARVVGPSGEEIHVDEWGRIKVRFLFTRNEDHSHDSGAGSNDNDTDSAWVDVLTPWAGEGYGVRFLPRINEIVVIDFFEGDIDRPFVTGRIHEGQRQPTQFDNTGKLPATKKLAGIKSKEYQGTGYNQLRFDDTTGQISTQLNSSHGTSQLNLGKLSHPKTQAESEDRGEGFELRTEHWGAVRAGQGLLISTDAQQQVQGDHLDATQAKQQLEHSQSNTKALSEIAKNQHTDEIESIQQLKAFASEIKQDIAKFNKALLLLNSPDGIALTTQEDIHFSADGQINHYAGNSINVSTQNNYIVHALNKMSLFSIQDVKFVAAQGKFSIHAQSNGMEIFAKLDMKISSVDGQIVISAPKGVSITTDHGQIRLDNAGITLITDRVLENRGGQHVFKEGAKVESYVPVLPKLEFAKPPFSAQYQLFKADGRNFQAYKYFVDDHKNNQIADGVTDQQGFIHQVITQTQEKIKAYKSVMRESERIIENWEPKLEVKTKKMNRGEK